MQRSPAVYDIAKAAAEFQSLFQSLRDWKGVRMTYAVFGGETAHFSVECPSEIQISIAQSFTDKGFTFTCRQWKGSALSPVTVWLFQVELPKEEKTPA